ncbi:MAG: prolyl oligopeptidase family serine peptidase [Kiritimatiellae bacterium]|nr:prolyl oligopeptidase family serine peptidase [Kiritimatiellia bacterium]
MVQLHGRGGGKPEGGILAQYKCCVDKDGVGACPDDFYVLALDSMRDFNVAANKTHDEFWWGACPKFAGPSKKDLPRLLKGPTSCERRVLATVEWVAATFGVDRDRIYLSGNSMGGQGALAIGLSHGEVFAAVNANVPATIWYPAARLGFVKADGSDDPAFDASKFADPPVCVDWSGSDDVWSRDHEVFYRNMAAHRYFLLGLWGDYGHCGSVSDAKKKNPEVGRFDWLAVRKNAVYPVFTNASTDDVLPWPFRNFKPNVNTWGGWAGDIRADSHKELAEGAKPVGQVNAYFRWENVRDEKKGVVVQLWTDGVDASTADVTLRRVQGVGAQPGRKARWTFGAQKGAVSADATGHVTIPGLKITSAKQKLAVKWL